MQASQYIGNKTFELIEGQAIPPAKDEVRLNVGFVGICGTDMHIYHGVMDERIGGSRTTGHEMSGTIEELGSDVEGFEIGDRVVVRPLDWCGECPACDAGNSHICHNLKFMGIDSPGAFQSSWTVKSRTLHKLPDSVTLQQGALIEPLAVACHDVSRARLKAGERAVVIGGGPIGQLVAIVARSLGAEVMLSEVNDVRRDFAEKNGILTVNPIEQDINDVVNEWTGDKGADVVFEVSGVGVAVETMTSIASVRGRICMVAIHSQKPPIDLFQFFWRELELVGARVYEGADFDMAIDLVASGKVDLEPFISSISRLENINAAFASMDGNPAGMKALIDCTAKI